MVNRRSFLHTLAAVASVPPLAASRARAADSIGFGPLQKDPRGMLDLPRGFSYEVISRYGDAMDDGLLVPSRHDGMAAFARPDGQLNIVCNHECYAVAPRTGPFGRSLEHLSSVNRDLVYDFGNGKSPGNGGTTTIVYDPSTRERKRIHMSLAGTEINCAGGPTPWGSWLSCEEIFRDAGSSFEYNRLVNREKRHGYIFEVAADATGMVKPQPITEMGRFEHEAAAVDPATGVVYLTEDRHDSLLYRFVPNEPGKLLQGGVLQALAVKDRPTFDTRNWFNRPQFATNARFDCEWLDLNDPDVDSNELRLVGQELGAAMFARGEGICYAAGEIVITATIGGAAHLGQVFAYKPGQNEGTATEQAGQLRLLVESEENSVLHNADNVSGTPWGDLVVCEDTQGHCGLVGVQADGTQYPIADNPYSDSELAGVCFAPDGKTMFVNIQVPGATLAITGPWSDGDS